ncbi:TPM domain-containing protein [bacterium]|nr:TPM domain-containing protein [bacterium]
MHRLLLPILLFALSGAAGPPAAPASLRLAVFPDRPQEGVHVLDRAGLLDRSSRAAVEAIASDLLANDGYPLYVVTLQSLAQQRAPDASVEAYTVALMESWSLSAADSRAMVLVVFADDRQARIQLAAGWPPAKVAQTTTVMERLILPRFKRQEFSRGLVDGANGLKAIARGNRIPGPAYDWTHAFLAFLGLSALAALGWWTFRESTDGLGGYLIGAVAGVAGLITGHLLYLLLGLVIARPICLETHRWRRWRAKGLGEGEDDPGRQPHWSQFIFGRSVPALTPASTDTGSQPPPYRGGGFGGGFTGGGGATGSW